MKKALALILALCMVMALCACGQSAAPAATEAPAAADVPAADAPAETDIAWPEGGFFRLSNGLKIPFVVMIQFV